MRWYPVWWYNMWWYPVWWHAMRRSMNINHPYFSHTVRGRGWSLGAQSRQLAVSGLLSVQRGVIYGVCWAGATIRACGADGGTVKSPHSMFRSVQTRTGVWSVCIHEHVRVRVYSLCAPGQSVTFGGHVLVWLHVSPLQDGTGTGRNGANWDTGI